MGVIGWMIWMCVFLLVFKRRPWTKPVKSLAALGLGYVVNLFTWPFIVFGFGQLFVPSSSSPAAPSADSPPALLVTASPAPSITRLYPTLDLTMLAVTRPNLYATSPNTTPRTGLEKQFATLQAQASLTARLKLPTPWPATSLPPGNTLGCPAGCTIHKDGCDIKGVISRNTREKLYILPGGLYYNQVTLDPGFGDRWFCSEAEARANGWVIAQQ